jgi:cell division protein FtsI (penicillin-binding protein 3)
VADQQGSRVGISWATLARSVRGWRSNRPVAGRRDAERVAGDWRATVRSRLRVCAAIFAAWTVAIEGRLLQLQVFQHADMMARADRQQLRTITPAAKRGEIFDRNGRVLAYSVDGDAIAADPSEVIDPEAVAGRVCEVLERCGPQERQVMLRNLRKKGQFVYLRRVASPDDARKVQALNLSGVMFYKESRRYYPNMELAAHVLGYVGTDNIGLAGLESTYDARIRGREGRMLVQTDARQHVIQTREERPPTAGDDLELTIDQYLQHIAERELRAGVEEHRAAGGTAIIMSPHTGEILALANWPTFNPNVFRRSDDAARRNRAIQDLYEPGSTFKVVTASAALEEQVIVPEDPVDCSPGYIVFPGRPPIRDVHTYGVLPFSDVIVKSSNVGAIKVGLKLGPERFGRYVSRFGFGQTLAPDFPGENPGIVWSPAKVDASALASMSMGYQVGVTPLQMAAAVSAVANGGELIEPRIVRAFVSGDRRVDVPKKVLRRSINERTAAELTAIMEAVVERGTARGAQIDGYTIAGKTGTSSMLVKGRYSKSDYNASFVGFVPSRKPAFTIVVAIAMENVHCGTCYYGGVVAAPIFKRIAEAALRHAGVGPTLNAPPPVLVARRDGAGDVEARPARAPALLKQSIQPAQSGLMPDVRGLSAREALRTLARAGVATRIDGSGFVLEQSIEPGVALVRGETCVLKLGRQSGVAAGGTSP